MFRVGAYLRLSKDDGDKEVSDSIENQKTLIENFIGKQDDMLLVDFYIDDGYSGLNFERPAFTKMIAEVYKANINTIITKDMSRLGREHIETSNYIEKIFPSNSIRYISILDNYDSLTGSNVEVAPFKSLLNDMYAKDISKKVRSAFNSKRARGEFIGAFAPYGYKKHPDNSDLLVVDEYAAGIINRIFQLYLKGTSKLQIAKILNQENIVCPSLYKNQSGDNYRNSNKLDATSYWTYSTINKILHNQVYVGHMVQGKSETISYKVGKKKNFDKEYWVIVRNTHEPIIDISDFETAQKSLETRKRSMGLNGNVTMYAGILKCGDCGRAMSKTSRQIGKGVKMNYYKCGTYKAYGKNQCTSHSIREDTLSAIVLQTIKNEAKKSMKCEDINTLTEFVEKMQAKDKAIGMNGILHSKLDKVNRYLTKAYEDYTDGLLDKEEYIRLREQHSNEKKEVENKLRELEDICSEKETTFSHHNEWARKFINYIDVEEVTRELLVELVDYIKVFEGMQLEVKLKFESPYL